MDFQNPGVDFQKSRGGFLYFGKIFSEEFGICELQQKSTPGFLKMKNQRVDFYEITLKIRGRIFKNPGVDFQKFTPGFFVFIKNPPLDFVLFKNPPLDFCVVENPPLDV